MDSDMNSRKKGSASIGPQRGGIRLRCEAISGRVGSGIRCDYGGLYNVYYIRDYHARNPHLRPVASVGGVQLRSGTGKTAKGWVSKQCHGAAVLSIISAGGVVGDLETMKEVMKMRGREPWTESEGGDVNDSDQSRQDNSPGEIDPTGNGGNIPASLRLLPNHQPESDPEVPQRLEPR